MGKLTKKIATKNDVKTIQVEEELEDKSSTSIAMRLIVAIIIIFLIVSIAFYGLV